MFSRMVDPCGYSPYSLPNNCKEAFDFFYSAYEGIQRTIAIRNEVVGKEFDWTKDFFSTLSQQKTPVETYYHYKKGLKRAHFIADGEKIKKVMHFKRNDTKCNDNFPFVVKDILGDKNNLLVCPYSSHRKLRSPFEGVLNERSLRKKDMPNQIAKTMLEQLSIHSEIMDSSDLVAKIIGKNLLGIEISSKELLQIIQEGVKDEFAINIFNKDIEENKLLDILINNQSLNLEEKISTLKAFLIAGTYTTSIFFKFFLNRIQEEKIYEKINSEWEIFLNIHKLKIENAEDLQKALVLFVEGGKTEQKNFTGSSFLENCFYETLRLHPIFPDISRIAKENFQLEELMVAKGDEIHLNIQKYQRDTLIWGEDAEEFNPERFEKNPKLKSEILAFSLGSQHCIGKNLVKIESKLYAAMMAILFKRQDPEKIAFKVKMDEFQSAVPDNSEEPWKYKAKENWDGIMDEISNRLFEGTEEKGKTLSEIGRDIRRLFAKIRGIK